jgi:SsrA-binding protein
MVGVEWKRMNVVAENKKVLFDYHILERFEAGIVLTGDEVKALRAKQCSLKGSFAQFYGADLVLLNATIAMYKHSYYKQDDAQKTRSRRLLLHRRELRQLHGALARKGQTLVPLKIYFNDRGLAKVELGLAVHKKKADKRQSLRERDIDRETMRELKNYT